MLRTLLRRTAIGVLGFAAVLFSVFGTQPTDVAAQDIFTRIGCTYGDYACYYTRTGVAVQGYPTVYQPYAYNAYAYPYVGYNYAPVTYSYNYVPYAYNTYTPAFYNTNYFVPSYARYPFYNNYFYGYAYGYVPDRFFSAVGCNVGNYTCLRQKV